MSPNTARASIPWRAGLRGGLTEFRQDFAPARLPGQLLWPALTLAAMYWLRHHDVAGIPLGSMMLPSVLGMFTIFGTQLMIQYLAADREDGTLLRARATPAGIAAYLIGKVTLCALTVLTYLTVVAVPGAFIVHGLAPMTVQRVGTLCWVLLLGMAASLALGAVLGALVPSIRAAGYAALALMAWIAISGVFYPITILPTWLRLVGEAGPIYWVGHGMRAALLPDAYASVEPATAWQLPPTALALSAWTVAGVLLAPTTLRAMTRKESGSRLATRHQRAIQRTI